MSILELPENDRPREKLLGKGAASLTDAELLAIFVRTGLPGKSALKIAYELLEQYGSLRRLLQLPAQEFVQLPGLGPAKYVQLQAVLELNKRYLFEEIFDNLQLKNPKALDAFLLAKLADREQEVFAALFFTAKCQLIAYEELFCGSITGAVIYPRELVKRALFHNAAGLVIAHNHPSGDPEPSEADWQLTKNLRQMLEFLDIRLLQHVVVGRYTCHYLLDHFV